MLLRMKVFVLFCSSRKRSFWAWGRLLEFLALRFSELIALMSIILVQVVPGRLCHAWVVVLCCHLSAGYVVVIPLQLRSRARLDSTPSYIAYQITRRLSSYIVYHLKLPTLYYWLPSTSCMCTRLGMTGHLAYPFSSLPPTLPPSLPLSFSPSLLLSLFRYTQMASWSPSLLRPLPFIRWLQLLASDQ